MHLNVTMYWSEYMIGFGVFEENRELWLLRQSIRLVSMSRPQNLWVKNGLGIWSDEGKHWISAETCLLGCDDRIRMG